MSKKDVEDLYRGYLGIDDPSEIDIDAIAYIKGVTVKRRHLTGCEARIIGVGDRAIITVNESSLPVRQRFSIGHELGHWFKHKGAVGNLCNANQVRANRTSLNKVILGKEAVANNYAAELLMPQYLIDTYIDLSSVSFDHIRAIQSDFSVSQTSAAIRYVDQSEFPVMLVSYGGNGARNWWHKSRSVPDYLYPNKLISFQGRREASKRIFGEEVDAETWLDGRLAHGKSVFEASWNIPDGGLMVFIWWLDDWSEDSY